MFISMPIEDKVTNKDEPPYEIKGKGITVKGIRETLEALLINI